MFDNMSFSHLNDSLLFKKNLTPFNDQTQILFFLLFMDIAIK
jgi:hypothetical protein